MARVKVFRKERPGEVEEVVVRSTNKRQTKPALGFPLGKKTKGGARTPPAVLNEPSPNQPN